MPSDPNRLLRFDTGAFIMRRDRSTVPLAYLTLSGATARHILSGLSHVLSTPLDPDQFAVVLVIGDSKDPSDGSQGEHEGDLLGYSDTPSEHTFDVDADVESEDGGSDAAYDLILDGAPVAEILEALAEQLTRPVLSTLCSGPSPEDDCGDVLTVRFYNPGTRPYPWDNPLCQ